MTNLSDDGDIEEASAAQNILNDLRRLLLPYSEEEYLSRARVAAEKLRLEIGAEERDTVLDRFEDPLNSFVQELVNELNQVVPHLQGSPVPKIVAGTLPVPSLDAWILRTSYPEPILVISQGLLTFCNLFAKVIAGHFSFQETEDGMEFELEPCDCPEFRMRQEKSAGRLADLLVATIKYDNPHLAEPYLLTGPNGELAGILRLSMEGFLIARLVVLAGRRELPIVPCPEWAAKLRTPLSRATPKAEDVILADALGLFATEFLLSERGVHRVLGCWGVDLALAGIQIVESTRRAAGYPVPTEEVCVSTRRALLKELLEGRVDTMEGSSEILQQWEQGVTLLKELATLIPPHFKRHSRRIAVSLRSRN